MDITAVALAAMFGLLIGSFLNVVIHRVPLGLSIVRPGSMCPSCERRIAWHDNIPVVSWLILRGRCRQCDARISARYPLVEVATAVLFAVIAARFRWTWTTPAFVVFAAVLLAVSIIDLEHRRIPTPIVWTGFALGLALLIVATVAAPGRTDMWPVLRGLIGAGACGGAFLVIALAAPRGMGMGDVRLVTLEGLFLGWLGAGIPLVGLFLGFLLGSVVGIALMIVRRAGRKSKIPFGPFLAGGAVIAMLWGQNIVNAYRGYS